MEYNLNFITLAVLLIILILLYIILVLNKKLSELNKQINNESRYKKFVESISVPMFYKENNGTITYTNPSFDIAFGINRIKTIQTISKLLKKPLEQLELNYDNDIQKRAIIFSSSIYDKKSDTDGKIGIIFDINTFKKDIISLLTWKQRYSLAIEGPEYGLWDWNILEGDFYFSNQWKKIMGYDVNDKPHSLNSWLSLVDSRDIAKVNEALNRHISGLDKIFNVEHRIRLSGELKWANVRGKALFDHEDNATRMIGLMEDVSERKIVEVKLSKNQRLFASFIDNLPGIAFIKDAQSRYIYLNRYYENLIGFKEWKNKTPSELFDEKTAKQIVENDKKAFFQGEKTHKESIANEEGSYKDFETYKFPVSEENGEKLLCGFGIELSPTKLQETKSIKI